MYSSTFTHTHTHTHTHAPVRKLVCRRLSVCAHGSNYCTEWLLVAVVLAEWAKRNVKRTSVLATHAQTLTLTHEDWVCMWGG